MLRSNWSGGITTQLYISPPTELYSHRNFDIRISSATIETEESDFTPLSGFSRIIMVLEGKLEIIHKNQYTKILNRFDTDFFSGDWLTSSKGKVVDFNLMMGKKVSGTMNAVILADTSSISKTIFESENFVAYYVVSGKLNFESESIHSTIQIGEMIVLRSTGISENIVLNGNCEIIEICCCISD
jgi:environmental stress-induced protein Ves